MLPLDYVYSRTCSRFCIKWTACITSFIPQCITDPFFATECFWDQVHCTMLNANNKLRYLLKTGSSLNGVHLQIGHYGCDPFNQNSDRSNWKKRSTSKCGAVFFKTFLVEPNRSIEFWTEIFREFCLNVSHPVERIFELFW